MRDSTDQVRLLRKAFDLPAAPAVTCRRLPNSAISVMELRSDPRNFGLTKPFPHDDAFLVSLQLRSSPDFDQFFDGRYKRPENFGAGFTSIYDLRDNPTADHRDPFHLLLAYLPRHALDKIAEEAGLPRIDELRYDPAIGMDDPVVRQLLQSLLPALSKPEEASCLFVDHVTMALCAHIVLTYGGMKGKLRAQRGGLAAWQERRAKEMLAANLCGEVQLDRLAAECGLSVRHFSRSFRQSVGVPPHRWLLQHRVDYAKGLLGNSALSLAEIALHCGFADQSHFTRVFTAMAGVSPGVWRRTQR